MCRIFGFKSVLRSQVHHSLVGADNALSTQSLTNPDGWGISYYVEGAPHVIKSDKTMMQDSLFRQVSGVVSSDTLIAHIRSSTIGDGNILNTHPFQYGRWTFAHNGNIKNFSYLKESLRQEVHPSLSPFILGDTDSEIIFYILLSQVYFGFVSPNTVESENVVQNKKSNKSNFKLNSTPQNTPSNILGGSLDESCSLNLNQLIERIQKAIQKIITIIGPLLDDDTGPNTENYLSFILSDGQKMIAFQGGKNIHYSTYKRSCPDKHICKHYGFECEHPTQTNTVKHLMFSSEPLTGQNVWIPMSFLSLVAIDENMNLKFSTI